MRKSGCCQPLLTGLGREIFDPATHQYRSYDKGPARAAQRAVLASSRLVCRRARGGRSGSIAIGVKRRSKAEIKYPDGKRMKRVEDQTL